MTNPKGIAESSNMDFVAGMDSVTGLIIVMFFSAHSNGSERREERQR
jgi:hypothetical protein